MSWTSILSTIEKDINAGFGIVAPILGTFDPGLGPVLTEIGTVIGIIEGAIYKGSGGTISPNMVTLPSLTHDQMSDMVRATTAVNMLKQFNANRGIK